MSNIPYAYFYLGIWLYSIIPLQMIKPHDEWGSVLLHWSMIHEDRVCSDVHF